MRRENGLEKDMGHLPTVAVEATGPLFRIGLRAENIYHKLVKPIKSFCYWKRPKCELLLNLDTKFKGNVIVNTGSLAL